METSTPSHSRYVLTILAVILVVTALILIALNALQLDRRFGAVTQISTGDVRQAYADGYLAARKKYQALCPLVGLSMTQFVGTVQSISGDTLMVLQQSLDTDPLVDGVSDIRTVLITAQTAIQRMEEKPREQIEKELRALNITTERAVPPSPHVLTSVKLSDVQVGQRVSVRSASDVRMESSIRALSITLTK